MKKILFVILIITAQTSFAQEIISPGNKSIQTKWIKEESYSFKWYMLRDTVKNEIGTINVSVTIKEKKIFIVQQVVMKNMKVPWVDSTIADSKTIAPIYHSSHNGQRDMALNYKNRMIDGYYFTVANKKNDNIQDSASSLFFDSNIYTSLLSWLPLQEGYSAKIPVYDYNSKEKHGLVYITVNSVKKGKYITEQNKEEDVFMLDVTDGISNSNSTYYISVKNRQQLKMNTTLGKNTIEVIRVM